jgi:hypothetical protein
LTAERPQTIDQGLLHADLHLIRVGANSKQSPIKIFGSTINNRFIYFSAPYLSCVLQNSAE